MMNEIIILEILKSEKELKNVINSLFKSRLWLRILKLLYYESNPISLTEIKKKLEEKGLMVVRNALLKLQNYPINHSKIVIIQKNDLEYVITESGKYLWEKITSKNYYSDIINKYISIINEVTHIETKIFQIEKKIRNILSRIKNEVMDRSSFCLDDINDKISKIRQRIHNKVKNNRDFIDLIIDDIQDYHNLNLELQSFDQIRQIKEYRDKAIKYQKDLLYFKSLIKNIETKLKRFTIDLDFKILNDIKTEFDLIIEKIQEIYIFKEIIKEINSISDIIDSILK